MPTINLDPDFFDHPKVRRLTGLLGRGAEVIPVRLWCFCAKYHADSGTLTDFSPQEVESVFGWWGRTGEAVDALLKVGFLEKIDNGYQVHDWLEHQGHLPAYRDRAQKANAARWAKARGAPPPILEGSLKDPTRTPARTPSAVQCIEDPPVPSARPPGGGRASAARPDEDTWLAYCRETWPVWREEDVLAAWAHYEARGWRTKEGPIRNWQAAARTCALRGGLNGTPRKSAPLPLGGARLQGGGIDIDAAVLEAARRAYEEREGILPPQRGAS